MDSNSVIVTVTQEDNKYNLSLTNCYKIGYICDYYKNDKNKEKIELKIDGKKIKVPNTGIYEAQHEKEFGDNSQGDYALRFKEIELPKVDGMNFTFTYAYFMQ